MSAPMSQHPHPANWDRAGDEFHPWDPERRTYARHCLVCGEYIDDVREFPGIDYVGDCCQGRER